MPHSSPLFKIVQLFEEWNDEQEEVIAKDDVLEELRKSMGRPKTKPVEDPLSFVKVLFKTIAEYQEILNTENYKDDKDR